MDSAPVVVVIGAGISGLSCAHRLFELKKKGGKNFDVLLLEAGDRLGGNIETEKRAGFVLEKGPDAFLREKPWALDLVKRLGLESEIIETGPSQPRSFLVRKGRLLAIPEGFYLIGPSRILPFLNTPIFSLRGKLRILSEAFIPKKYDDTDESVGNFIRRRFGKECLERAGQALLAGIYTGDPDTLSLLATMPRFRELEKKYGSVIRGLRREMGLYRESFKKVSGPRYGLFVSFKNGMQTLTDALSEKIPDATIHLNTLVKKISRDPIKNLWKIQTAQGQCIEADAVCVALPALQIKELLKQDCPALSEKLSELLYESVAVINMAYRTQELVVMPKKGFGFVAPRTEKRAVLACTFVDQKFENRAPKGGKLFRAFIGGAFGREFLEKNNQELVELAQKDMRELLGIKTNPFFSHVQRYPSAMVQYAVGHLDWLAEVRAQVEKNPGLHLTGSSFGGVGIPDCIREAEEQAEKIYTSLQETGIAGR